VEAAALLEAATWLDVPRLEAQWAGKAGGLPSAPPVAKWLSAPTAGLGLCLSGAKYSTLLKWQSGLPLLPADCAGRPCNLWRGPVDVFGDHAVSCKKSGLGDSHPGTRTFFC